MDLDLPLATAVLQRTPGVLTVLIRDLPGAWTDADEGEGTWSPHQVAGHMLHVEETDWMDRTRVILREGISRVFEPVDREAGFQRYAHLTLDRIVKTMAKQYGDAVGPWREYLPIIDAP